MSQQIVNNKAFTLVLPCYNPPEKWGQIVVDTIHQLEKNTNKTINLIIVNDGSTSNKIQEQFENINSQLSNFSYQTLPINKGKGYALRQGVLQVKTDITIYTDIDFPYTLESIESMLSELEKGTEITLGHRGQEYYKNTPWFRMIISKTLRWFLKTFLRLPTDDSQCGIKGFNKVGREAFLDTKIDRFLFDLEFIKLASKRKINCKIVAVTLKPNVVFSKVNLKILATESLNFFKVLFRK